MTPRGFHVSPMKRATIRAMAHKVRDLFGEDKPFCDVVRLVENRMPARMPDYSFEVEDDIFFDQFYGAGAHAIARLDEMRLIVRESVYENACRGKGRDRLTLAHEVGHFFLHTPAGLARRSSEVTKLYCDSEWQADAFGGELLVCSRNVVPGMTEQEIMDTFGVSADAARVQRNALTRDGIL